MKYALFFTISFLTPFFLNGQGFNNTMIFGYGGGSLSPDNDEYGLNILSFSDGSLLIDDNQTGEAFFNDTDAAISDETGSLMFYFNGIDVFNKEHLVMENGDTLNTYNFTGYDIPQGGIIIPHPGFPDQYILIHAREGYVAPWGQANIGVYYSIIDMSQNNGLGKVILRKQQIVIDTLEYGELAVVRHANGRDWWLAIGEAHHNTFYRVLINETGPHVLGKQVVGTNRVFSFGQAFFSPDGTKYTIFGGVNAGGLTQYADIYSFDRCSGLFSNHEHFEVESNSTGVGSSISPNSRWFYVALFDKILRYDLEATPIQPTRELIAEYQPFNDPFPTNFFWMFLAPDDRIYVVTSSGSRTLHVIDKPDETGLNCAFEQHGIRLVCTNNSSVPTAANYRLGPIDGSACDTLGIDNVPVSLWRYVQDTFQHARFEFRDLSYHEPNSWFWDFGDNATSTERHPTHEYSTAGIYQVCLTVSNSNGSNTHCKTLFSTVAIKDNPDILNAIQVSPNPMRGRLNVALSVNLCSPQLKLYDQLGRLVRMEQLAFGITEIETKSLSPGMYFWEVTSLKERIKSGRIVKIER